MTQGDNLIPSCPLPGLAQGIEKTSTVGSRLRYPDPFPFERLGRCLGRLGNDQPVRCLARLHLLGQVDIVGVAGGIRKPRTGTGDGAAGGVGAWAKAGAANRHSRMVFAFMPQELA